MAPTPGVLLRRRFLAARLLDRVLDSVSTSEGDPAAVQTSPGAALAVADEVRRAWEVELPDDLHDRIVAALRSVHADLEVFFGLPLDPCEAVAALRYPPGSFYRTHRDRSAQPDRDQLHRRAVSIVVFVNGGSPRDAGLRGRPPRDVALGGGPPPYAAFGGGTLRLHEAADVPSGIHDVTPEAGTMVAFPSSQLHEVTAVEWGTRVSLVTWLLTPDD